MSPWNTIVGLSKRASAIIGAGIAICTAYVLIGLPIPTTDAAVTVKLKPFQMAILEMRGTQLEILTDLTQVQRQQLRTERFALERASTNASVNDRLQFQLRMSQIDDDLKKLNKRDIETSKKE